MAVCARCAAPLVATARFCAACGSPVTRGGVAAPAVAPESRPDSRGPTVAVPAVPAPASPAAAPVPTAAMTSVAPSAPDPFASTVMGDPAAIAAIEAVRAAVPRAATAPLPAVAAVAAARPNPVSPMASSVMRDGTGQSNVPAPWNAGAAPAPPAYTPPPPSPYVPGAMVLVQWSNGQRYAGTVLQVSGSQVLVTFPNGAQHWVDSAYVSSGS